MARTTSSTKVRLWQERFKQLKNSQLSVQMFCQSVGCSAPTLYYWKRKLETLADSTAKTSKSLAAPPSPAFVPVLVRDSSSNQALVTLCNGTTIELHCDPTAALQLILQDMRAQ